MWVDNILLDLDADPYPDAFDELDRRADEIPEPDDVPDDPPPPGMEWLTERDEHGWSAWMSDPAKVAAFEKCRAETPPRPATPGEQAEQDALNHLATLREMLDQLRRSELERYADALRAAVIAETPGPVTLPGTPLDRAGRLE